jgi:hypothetical protein
MAASAAATMASAAAGVGARDASAPQGKFILYFILFTRLTFSFLYN